MDNNQDRHQRQRGGGILGNISNLGINSTTSKALGQGVKATISSPITIGLLVVVGLTLLLVLAVAPVFVSPTIPIPTNPVPTQAP